MIRRYVAGSVGVSIIALVAGCANLTNESTSVEALVAQQAEQRWQAIIIRDWNTAYGYSSPAYREAVTLDGFINQINGPIKRKEVKVRSVSCEEMACEVILTMRYEPLMPGFGEIQTDFNEKWVEQDRRWYIYQRL